LEQLSRDNAHVFVAMYKNCVSFSGDGCDQRIYKGNRHGVRQLIANAVNATAVSTGATSVHSN